MELVGPPFTNRHETGTFVRKSFIITFLNWNLRHRKCGMSSLPLCYPAVFQCSGEYSYSLYHSTFLIQGQEKVSNAVPHSTFQAVFEKNTFSLIYFLTKPLGITRKIEWKKSIVWNKLFRTQYVIKDLNWNLRILLIHPVFTCSFTLSPPRLGLRPRNPSSNLQYRILTRLVLQTLRTPPAFNATTHSRKNNKFVLQSVQGFPLVVEKGGLVKRPKYYSVIKNTVNIVI